MYIRLFKFIISSLFLLTFSNTLFSQDIETIWQPDISYSWKYSDKTSFSSKTAALQSISDVSNNSSLIYIESSITANYKVNSKLTVSGGYLFRWNSPLLSNVTDENRLIEQISYKTTIGGNSFSQRLRVENRFSPNKYRNRIRYKLGYTIPIKDSNRANYLIIADEFLNTVARDIYSAENRFGFGTGWKTSSKRAFEIVLEYRVNNIFNDSPYTHAIVLSTSFKLSR